MNGLDALHCFEFDDNLLVHYQVESIPTVEMHVLVFDWKIYLPAEGNVAQVKLVTEALFVCALEKSRPERAVHLDGGGDDLSGQILIQVSPLCLCASVLKERIQRNASSSAALASVFSSRYLMITGAYTDNPHSMALPRPSDREPGTTTAFSGTTSG
jgi:hypothetical protein